MKILKFLSIVGIMGLLTACGTISEFNPDVVQRVNTITVYPNLPDVVPVEEPNIIAWKHDVPRNLDKLVVKNISSCKKVPEENQDSDFWRRCGEYPIVTNTNIHVGFDQDNWTIIVENFLKLKATIAEYRTRIEEVNKQRSEWREKNQAEFDKLQSGE